MTFCGLEKLRWAADEKLVINERGLNFSHTNKCTQPLFTCSGMQCCRVKMSSITNKTPDCVVNKVSDTMYSQVGCVSGL